MAGDGRTDHDPDEGLTETEGVWLAWHPDWSGMAVFPSEIDALRYAVQHHTQVSFVRYGRMVGPGANPDDLGMPRD